jgi:lipopolysaccharide/colanic/teichoic acid biosynthesis glycosyltransferase
MDIAYIERRGLWLDFIILFKTALAVLERRGAK